MQHIENLGQHPGPIRPLFGQMTHRLEQRARVALQQRLQHAVDLAMIEGTEHRPHIGGQHLALAEGNRLIGQAHRVAHRAVGGTPQQPQRIHFEGDLLDGQHMGQVLDHPLRRHVLQRELQAARKDGDRQLLRVGGGEQELDVGRRLFEGLEQGVERVRGQHVHFVDQVDLVAAAAGRVLHVVEQLAGVLDLGPAGGIHLDQVDETPLVDLPAYRALAARRRADALLAIQALGQDACDGGLTHATGAREQIGMVQPLVVQRIDQGLEHMGLADHFAERARTPLTGKNLITHRIVSLGAVERGGQC
ncbi:hypothetical protein D3C78_1050100 [compost metagenome]